MTRLRLDLLAAGVFAGLLTAVPPAPSALDAQPTPVTEFAPRAPEALKTPKAPTARRAAQAPSALGAPLPPSAWNAQDPADSLYRAGRDAMRRDEWRRAAQLFREVRRRHPGSEYAADAPYWEAFALQRLGGRADLEAARTALLWQQEQHPDAATRGDARTLMTRIDGQLASRGDAMSGERVVRRADGVAQGCPDKDDDERLMVMDALITMDAERALPTIKQVLARRDACSAPLREKAVFLVSQKRSAETEDILLETLKNDPDQKVREQAVFWLGQVNSERSTNALIDIIGTSRDQAVLDKAVFALSQQRNERASNALRELVQRESAPVEVRANAIFWLGQRRDGQGVALRYLTGLWSQLREPELRERTLFAISQQKSPDARRFLLDVLRNDGESSKVRSMAAFHAAQAGATSRELQDVMRGTSDRDVKQQLLFAITQTNDADELDVLMDVVRNDADREVRKQAIFWIGQSKDARAAEFLRSILDR